MLLLRLGTVFAVVYVVLGTVTTRKEKHEEFVDKVKEEHMKNGGHNKEFDREILWGDDDDDYEEEVEKLPPPEQKRRLKLLVENRIDADKDGYVSIEELSVWAERSYDIFETDETRSLFPDIDSNRDGSIQWSEYAEDTYGEDFNEDSEDFIKPPSEEWEEFVKTYKQEKRKFEVADLDNDGSLSLEEFQYFKHPRLHEKTRNIVEQETLDSSDLNNDGAIDINEFLGDYQKTADENDPEWTIFEREKFEHEYDVNKDGLLKGEEIVQWMAGDNKALAVEEAEHLMEETDSDHDGRLSVDEILQNHIDWVDSDATDYGRQLLKHHDEL